MVPLVEGKELKYMYRGTTGKNVFNGCGYATVNFTEAGMTRGHGHFIEETAIKERKESRYMKLTPDTMEEIFGNRFDQDLHRVGQCETRANYQDSPDNALIVASRALTG
jgi:hypothetical protein